ncbi:hypothetical protein BD779DRAFT_781697 [Infundibulicybe gibba]|nr:hypothetical protein BD779DRAFT_781697 [Infundibulicybe gibba]
MLECILYGAYIVLFVQYLVLRHRNNRRPDRLLTLAHILLFCLCTVSFCLDIPSAYLRVVPNLAKPLSEVAPKLNLSSMVIFAIIDFLARAILLYRCWIIWDKRWVVVAVPGFLALVALGGGFALAGLRNPFLWGGKEWAIHAFKSIRIMTNSVSLVVNALTTSLIVTKIFLTSREARSVLSSNLNRPFRIATAMVIESGLLMFAFQLAFIFLFLSPGFEIVSTPTSQIYGITPTLLNIRVIMGSVYDKTTMAEKSRPLRFAHTAGVATHATNPSTSTGIVQLQGTITEPNASNNKKVADNVVEIK